MLAWYMLNDVFMCLSVCLSVALQPMDNKSSLKGAWFGSCDPFFACTTVDLEKLCLGTPLTEINLVVNDRPLAVSLIYGTADTSSIGLIYCVFDANLLL